jgi:hypothetical protein
MKLMSKIDNIMIKSPVIMNKYSKINEKLQSNNLNSVNYQTNNQVNSQMNNQINQ